MLIFKIVGDHLWFSNLPNEPIQRVIEGQSIRIIIGTMIF